MSNAVILGSAFDSPTLAGAPLEPVELESNDGPYTLYRWSGPAGREGWVSYRHGVPHRLLPNQIPYRAQAAALEAVGCQALLVTSSVGVLDRSLPLDAPLLVDDLIMPGNRLPDGSACTLFDQRRAEQGHLVLDEGLLSRALSAQVADRLKRAGFSSVPRVIFAYTQGPRTKTAAENVFWSRLGAQVDSMTVGPEVVLANELQIPTAALVVGHKYSIAGVHERLDRESTNRALATGAELIGDAARDFLASAEPVPFGNRVYRY